MHRLDQDGTLKSRTFTVVYVMLSKISGKNKQIIGLLPSNSANVTP